MKNKLFFILIMVIFFTFLFGSETETETETVASDSTSSATKIIFVELGSTTCVPCKQMEKVLDVTKEKYGEQIEIIFFDIMKNRQKAKEFNVKIMPTQVFLDVDGNEIYRHIGFFPQQQLDVFLQNQGLIPLTNSN